MLVSSWRHHHPSLQTQARGTSLKRPRPLTGRRRAHAIRVTLAWEWPQLMRPRILRTRGSSNISPPSSGNHSERCHDTSFRGRGGRVGGRGGRRRRGGQAQQERLCALEELQARRARVAIAVGARPPRLAHRVLGHRLGHPRAEPRREPPPPARSPLARGPFERTASVACENWHLAPLRQRPRRWNTHALRLSSPRGGGQVVSSLSSIIFAPASLFR